MQTSLIRYDYRANDFFERDDLQGELGKRALTGFSSLTLHLARDRLARRLRYPPLPHLPPRCERIYPRLDFTSSPEDGGSNCLPVEWRGKDAYQTEVGRSPWPAVVLHGPSTNSAFTTQLGYIPAEFSDTPNLRKRSQQKGEPLRPGISCF